MRVPKFDVFAGRPGSADVFWKEAVAGLGAANDRMKELAAMSPGSYFVFDFSSGRILAHMDNSPGRGDEKREAS